MLVIEKAFLLALVLVATPAFAQENNEKKDPYRALQAVITKLDRNDVDGKCSIKGVIDLNAVREKMDIFREGFLSKDNSLDFYLQRSKQVLAFVLVKRVATYLTEGLYQEDKEKQPCQFSLDARYFDKFGQDKALNLVSWRFTKEQNEKINWEKFEVKHFTDIALDFKYNDELANWISDEPQAESNAAPAPRTTTPNCDMFLFRANAIFIRATTFCRKNYMDSSAGYAALDASKQCFAIMGENRAKAEAESAMLYLDKTIKTRGRSAGCMMVEKIANEIDSPSP